MGVIGVYRVSIVHNFYGGCTGLRQKRNWHNEGKAAHHYVFGLVDLSASVHSKIILTYTSQGEGWRFESQLGYTCRIELLLVIR